MLELLNFLQGNHTLKRFYNLGAGRTADDRKLLLAVHVAELELHEEAVDLRFRQREGAVVFQRVLGRHDHERLL